jgi:hypothetical protein
MMILVHNEGRPGATNHKVAGGTIWRSSLGTVESHLGCDGECDYGMVMKGDGLN